jgi:type II secretory pathway pseudopilin PulG
VEAALPPRPEGRGTRARNLMEKNQMKKRALTLIEIMIVIFLITLITGAVGYNMKGSLNKGKQFRTIQAQEQLHDLLLICIDEGADPDKIAKDPAKYLTESGLAKDPKNLINDGWGKKFTIVPTPDKKDFEITSSNLAKK